MKNSAIYLVLIYSILFAFFSGCDLEKEIEVPLPEYQSKLVVECYLEPEKPLRMAVSESASYLSSPSIPDVLDAQVSVEFNGQREVLSYKPEVDTINLKAYNYTSEKAVEVVPNANYVLNISDTKGRKITGSATFLPLTPIKEVEWKYNKDSLAFLLIRFDDVAATDDYYRIQVHKDSLNKRADVDFTLDDSFTTNNEVTLGTGYNYQKGDIVYVTLFHIEKSYFDFLESIEDAANANGNPFAQPSQIKSSVNGGLGVFATLVYDRRMVVVE